MDETQVALCTVSKVIYWCLHIIDNNVEDSNENFSSIQTFRVKLLPPVCQGN